MFLFVQRTIGLSEINSLLPNPMNLFYSTSCWIFVDTEDSNNKEV